jgi:hypothetical protein
MAHAGNQQGKEDEDEAGQPALQKKKKRIDFRSLEVVFVVVLT